MRFFRNTGLFSFYEKLRCLAAQMKDHSILNALSGING